MTYYRDAQNKAHPNKTNTLLLGITFLLINIVGIQIWLLFSALNNALDENYSIAFAAFIGSSILFIASVFFISFLPDPRGQSKKKYPHSGSKYS